MLSSDQRFLLVVNAGSDEISSFAVRGATLELRDTISSGGDRPVSITEHNGLVYAVNAGQPANVAGFWLDAWGGLHTLAQANMPLSTMDAAPGQIQVSSDGDALLVTEKSNSVISTFRIDGRGRLTPAETQMSLGRTPFGFDITTRGVVVVSEAATQSASSYDLMRKALLEPISAVIPDTQAAPCWVVLSRDDRYAFVANAGSSSISSYAVSRHGELTLLDAVAGDVGPNSRPLDMAVSRSGRQLYVLDRGNAGVLGFALSASGALEPIDFMGALPPFASGLAAY